MCYAKSLQSCSTLCQTVDYNPPDSSAHGILQARILEWVAVPSSRRSSRPRNWTRVAGSPALADGLFTTEPPGKTICSEKYNQKFLEGNIKNREESKVGVRGIFFFLSLSFKCVYYQIRSSEFLSSNLLGWLQSSFGFAITFFQLY